MPEAALIDTDMVTHSVRVAARDVVYVKGLLEASEGLAAVFAVKGGDLTLATSWSQDVALRAFISDLSAELELEVVSNGD